MSPAPLRRARRRLVRALGLGGGYRAVHFLYHRRYRIGLASVPMDAMRGERVLAWLLDEGWTSRGRIVEPRPASIENLRRVHTEEYLRSLDDPEVVGRVFGVPLDATAAAAAVEMQRLAAGGTIQASRLALRHRAPVIHLGGGFHHASPARGTGFCLLNDAAVAIARLRARGFEEPVLVVDLDLHDGNGTRAAFADDPSVHTFSVHNETWDEIDAVADTCIELGAGVDDDTLMEALGGSLPRVVRAHRPQLTFFLAGADVAADDAYGNWEMTPEGILRRDRFVVETVTGGGSRHPLVILLAGGYGATAWRAPARLSAWLLSGRDAEPPDELTVALGRVRWLEEPAVGGAEGESEALWSLGSEDLGALGVGAAGEEALLGRYPKARVERDLERFGILSQAHARGYRDLRVELVPSSGLGPTVRLFGTQKGDEHLLLEIRVERERGWVPGATLLTVEWLLLQDPCGTFPEGRPPLPDQRHPGLGVLADVVAWLVTLCREAELDGLAFRSSHFHIAALARRHLRFLRPEDERRFRLVREATRHLPLAAAARTVAAGEVVDPATGEPLRWVEVPMIVPVSDDLGTRLGPRDGS